MLTASAIVIGDEILSGDVRDENSPWLAKRLARHGVPFRRIQVVPDLIDSISDAVRLELSEGRRRLILTSGGVGPTLDDVTYQAVANAVDVEVVKNGVIADNIAAGLQEIYGRGIEVNDAYVSNVYRMAYLPHGAQLLDPEATWAPGAMLDIEGGLDRGGVTIVILPGVPNQFRHLVSEVVEPRLLRGRNALPSTEYFEHDLPESFVAPYLVELKEMFPDLHIGSYPGERMLIRLSGPTDLVARAFERLRSSVRRLRLTEAGKEIAKFRIDRHREHEK